jgi:hypothetical protein
LEISLEKNFSYTQHLPNQEKPQRNKFLSHRWIIFEMMERKVLAEKLVAVHGYLSKPASPDPKTPPFAQRENEASGHHITEPASDRS